MKFKTTTIPGTGFTAYTSDCGRYRIEQMHDTGPGFTYAVYCDGAWTGKGAKLLRDAKDIARDMEVKR